MILWGGNCLFCCSVVPTLRVKSSAAVQTRGACCPNRTEAQERARTRVALDENFMVLGLVRLRCRIHDRVQRRNVFRLGRMARKRADVGVDVLRLFVAQSLFWKVGHRSRRGWRGP